jgi:hypothetical protein
VYDLEPDQIDSLIAIIREESGDNLSRATFTEAALQLFEDIAGFETLPGNLSRRVMHILWQGYRLAIRGPKQKPKNQH